VATYTWVDLHIPEAAKLADLSGILWDLRQAREFAKLLAREFGADEPNWQLVEPLSIAATVMYCRPFSGGVRHRLGERDLNILTTEQRQVHDHLRAYRDKHVAHSVNPLEENIPRANYCVERVKQEGITGISYGGGRVASLSGAEVAAIIELTTLLQAHIESQIAAEQVRLLPIVRRQPLEQVLAGGQKAFVVDVRTAVSAKRKEMTPFGSGRLRTRKKPRVAGAALARASDQHRTERGVVSEPGASTEGREV
jgi:hypothetical protein